MYTNYAMFTDQGNVAVAEAVNAIPAGEIDDMYIAAWNEPDISDLVERVQEQVSADHAEVGDTAVRDAIYEGIEARHEVMHGKDIFMMERAVADLANALRRHPQALAGLNTDNDFVADDLDTILEALALAR